ncbi:MAG: alkaline phosphatase family protein [Desulfobaccales bacterium]
MNRYSQRTVVCMYDGFGMDYFEMSPLPVMKRLGREGLVKRGRAVFPTLTNANNISICCAAWPAEHGVTTNCYFDEAAGKARFLEDADFILAPTIFQRFRQQGVRSALLTCKAKTLKLVGGHADLAVAAEEPSPEVVQRYGPPPPMYSAEVNYWLWEIALDLLQSHPDFGLIYVHTTDYPMHMWAPEESCSLDHLARLDDLLGAARDIAPDAMFLITADHGMNPKKRCLDLRKTCATAGLQLRFAVSPVADRLLRHHRGFGGVSYVYVHAAGDLHQVQAFLADLPGVDDALSRPEAARRFHLLPARIGDLVILAAKDTVFGDLAGPDEELAAGYRNHGSLYEEDIPLILYGYDGALPLDAELQTNFDLTRWLCRTRLKGI